MQLPNEYDKMMAAMGAQKKMLLQVLSKLFIRMMYQVLLWINICCSIAEHFRNPILRIFHTELEAVLRRKKKFR